MIRAARGPVGPAPTRLFPDSGRNDPKICLNADKAGLKGSSTETKLHKVRQIADVFRV